MYKIEYRKKIIKDIEKLKSIGLEKKVMDLINIIKVNPYQSPPPFEKLGGDLNGAYSRRINIQHRLVYQVLVEKNTVRILSLWSHYENI